MSTFIARSQLVQPRCNHSILSTNMSRPILKDLSFDVQTSIISHVISKELVIHGHSDGMTKTAVRYYARLSDASLAVAKISSGLAEATRMSLRERARVLSRISTDKIAEWIPILGPELKEFSLNGGELIGVCQRGCEENGCACGDLYADVLKALDALSGEEVALDLIDLQDLALVNESRLNQIANSMTKALHKSASTLKEVHIDVNIASTRAMERVTLPNLEVMQMVLKEFCNYKSPQFSTSGSLCGRILAAINSYGDRDSAESSLKELRIYNILLAPVIDYDTCRPFLHGIETLRVKTHHQAQGKEIVRFISNFKNLRSLHFDIQDTTAEDMNTIFEATPFLKELNMNLYMQSLCQLENIPEQDTFREVCISFRGTLRRLELDAILTSEQLKLLGQHSPNVENLAIRVDSANVRSLGQLLSTDCRCLQDLFLDCTAGDINGLGEGGWTALAEGICSASDELSVLGFSWNKKEPISDPGHEIVESIIDIIYFLGNRAKKISFQAPLETNEKDYVVRGTWRVVCACYEECKLLEVINLELVPDDPSGGVWLGSDRTNEYTLKLVRMWHKVCKLPHMKWAELGRFIYSNPDVPWELESLEMQDQ